MNIAYIPTLQHIAIAKVAAAICEHPVVHSFTLHKVKFEESEEEKQFLDIIGKLRQPKPFQSLLLIWVKILCLEIRNWREKHCKIIFSSVNNLIKFCWRHNGSIDRLKTAQALVKNEDVHYTRRFCLAACYFLEEDVWDLGSFILAMDKDISCFSLFLDTEILGFWLSWYFSGRMQLIDQEDTQSHLPDEHILMILENAGASLQCFVERLPIDQRLKWLKKITKLQLLTRDLALYCIYGPLRNQQLEIFRENASRVLYIFLTWPLQIMFMDVAKHLWNHLGEENYWLLFIHIWSKIDDGQRDIDFLELKREFLDEYPFLAANLF